MTKYTIYFSQSAEHPFRHFCEAHTRGSAAIAMHTLRRDYPCVTVEIKSDTGYVYKFTDGKYDFHKWRR
jgi:hypothetical protein